jgi:hypothetical protein
VVLSLLKIGIAFTILSFKRELINSTFIRDHKKICTLIYCGKEIFNALVNLKGIKRWCPQSFIEFVIDWSQSFNKNQTNTAAIREIE